MRLLAFLFAGLFGLVLTAAHARDYKAGSLEIADPWSHATPKGSSVAAGYMTIKNTGSTPDRLISGSSDAGSGFQIHEMKMEDGVAKMRPIKGGLGNQAGRHRRVQTRLVAHHVCWFEEAARYRRPHQRNARV